MGKKYQKLASLNANERCAVLTVGVDLSEHELAKLRRQKKLERKEARLNSVIRAPKQRKPAIDLSHKDKQRLRSMSCCAYDPADFE